MLKNNKLNVKNDSVWGKNIELEKFWRELASGRNVVIVYKNKSHKNIKLPNTTTKKYKSILNAFEEDPDIIAVISSNMSQDSYELILYPKAKNKSVLYVINHYTKYFKPMLPNKKLLIPF